MTNLRNITLALGMLVALPMAVQAAPLTGRLNISGTFLGEDAGGTNVRLPDAVAVDFCNFASCAAGGSTGQFIVLSTAGNISTVVSQFEIGTIQDFTFAPFSGPIANFFTLTNLSFDLNSLTFTQGVDAAGADFLNIAGMGVLRATDFDDTDATFSFSGQATSGALIGELSFSGIATPGIPVPAPAGLALLGLGLLGLGLARRRTA